MAIDLNSTMEEIIDEINSKGSGGGITELTTQYVRITDLEDGIYKWIYDDRKYLYYYGETGTSASSFTNGDVILIVYGTRSVNNTTYKYYKQWVAFAEPYSSGGNTSTSISANYIYYGYTRANYGVSYSRTLTNIPSSSAVLLTGAQTISGNKTFSGTTTFSGTVNGLPTGMQATDDITWEGDHTFNANVDFSNANVTGLPSSGGGGGLTKTKVTLAELQALCTTENIGMLVSIVCKNANNRALNDAVAPVLKVGYSSLDTTTPEIFNKVTSSISASGGATFTTTEYLFRILEEGVVFNKYTTTINLTNNTATRQSSAQKSLLTDANFDFYVYK